MEYNILVLSAGRRVELVKCFQKAAKKLNIKSKVVAADISDMAPAIYFADEHYLIPRIGNENYIQSIIDVCNKEDIKLIVPTIDTELLSMAENKELIENVTNAKVLISDIEVIRYCRDKINTQQFFEQHGFKVPAMLKDEDMDNGNVEFPVFIKPKDGSSSINAFQVNNLEELNFFRKYIKNPLVQELIVGDEYTIDVFLDFDSNIITMVPRRRLATRSGEIAKGQIVKDQEIIEDVTRLMKELKPIGHITVQCMKTAKGIEYIEINPRFGGGAPMTIMAGADSCENLFRLLMGEKLSYNENYEENSLFLRFDDTIMLKAGDTKEVKFND